MGHDRYVNCRIYTNSGVRYDQSYAWHMRFDKSGMVTEVKVWLDVLTPETVLSLEAAKLNGTTAKGKVSEGVGCLRGDTPNSHLRIPAKASCCQLLISA